MDEQEPHVVDGAGAGQLGGVVGPVVEEPLLAAHVADGGVRHDDALEAGRDVEGGGLGGRVHGATVAPLVIKVNID
ncbi:MAG: hypothetical protein R2699_12115 [Acidimicrobiales bacterium]